MTQGERAVPQIVPCGRPRALPKADAVALVRGVQTLGVVPWDELMRCLPGELPLMPAYLPRWMGHTFPAPWQVGTLRRVERAHRDQHPRVGHDGTSRQGEDVEPTLERLRKAFAGQQVHRPVQAHEVVVPLEPAPSRNRSSTGNPSL